MKLDQQQATKTRNVPSRDTDAEIGRRIHMLMWDRGLTNTAFSERLGIHQSALGRKLKGQSGWAASELLRIAEELNTTVAYLFGETDEPGNAKRPASEETGRSGDVAGAGLEPATSRL